MFTAEDIIYSYTRKDAIDDGVLIDVTETAKEAGFKYPVALTAGVWALIENIPKSYRGMQLLQDVEGRLWDVLWMARVAARRNNGSQFLYDLILYNGRRKMAKLEAVCGPAGPFDPSPVITIMLPSED